ncbi:MAG TPA: hypothetical protein VGH11_01805 [Jatrophihabitans sp.]|jgi:hypothetical protein
MNTANPNSTLDARLAALQDEYTYRVNMLLEEDRTDLAARLAEEYVEEAHQLVQAAS